MKSVRPAAVLLVLVLAAVTVRADEKPCGKIPDRFDVASAVRILKSAPGVWPDGMGIAGAPSCYAAAFRWLAAQRESTPDFERLAQSASPAGRLYGLAGLKKKSSPRFEEIAKDAFFDSGTAIEVIDGCIIHRVAARELAKDIRAGELHRFGVR
jgi:hypothetical protein